jgi:hypothetical protein
MMVGSDKISKTLAQEQDGFAFVAEGGMSNIGSA